MPTPAAAAEPEIADVAVAVLRRGECWLVGERAAGQALAGYAEFPGGKCLPGETPAECACRECREETGLEAVVCGEPLVVTHDYPQRRVRLWFFPCESAKDAEPRLPFRWVNRQKLCTLRFPPANREVIAAIVQGT